MSVYSIEEAAEATRVSKHTLRYYEREGLLPAIAKADNGHRRYRVEDIERVRVLQMLRATGMPIREMKQFVSLARAGDQTVPERMAILRRYREALQRRLAEERAHLASLDRKIGVYEEKLLAAD